MGKKLRTLFKIKRDSIRCYKCKKAISSNFIYKLCVFIQSPAQYKELNYCKDCRKKYDEIWIDTNHKHYFSTRRIEVDRNGSHIN